MKYEPQATIIAYAKVHLPKPDAEIDLKLANVLWRRVSPVQIELVPGSYDDTVFNGPNEGDPQYLSEKDDILDAAWEDFKDMYIFLDEKVLDASVDFGPTSVYARVPGEWTQLVIDRDHDGVPPTGAYLEIRSHRIQHVTPGTAEVAAVSDTADFAVIEEILNIEHANPGQSR